VIGLSAVQFARFCAEQPFTKDEVTIVEVTRPDGSIKRTVQGRELSLMIYPGTFDDVCELATRTPLATGTAKVTETDTDFFVSGKRTDVIGFSLVGRARSAETGAHFLVRAQVRALFPKHGESRLLRRDFSIKRVGH